MDVEKQFEYWPLRVLPLQVTGKHTTVTYKTPQREKTGHINEKLGFYFNWLETGWTQPPTLNRNERRASVGKPKNIGHQVTCPAGDFQIRTSPNYHMDCVCFLNRTSHNAMNLDCLERIQCCTRRCKWQYLDFGEQNINGSFGQRTKSNIKRLGCTLLARFRYGCHL